MCRFRYFLDINLGEPNVCDFRHVLMKKVVGEVAIVSINGKSYKVHIFGMSKDETMTTLQSSNLKNVV